MFRKTTHKDSNVCLLVQLYENPDHDAVSIGMWNYAKSLEDVETALLGGFYFKHFCVASKPSFQAPLFTEPFLKKFQNCSNNGWGCTLQASWA